MTRPPSPLSPAARRIVAEVARQFDHNQQALAGLCVTSEVRNIKHGLLGPAQPVDEPSEERIEASEIEDNDLVPLLSGEAYERVELPSETPGELHVRATRRGTADPASGEIPGADIVFQRAPARLLRAALHTPSVPGVAGWLITGTDATLAFDYVGGVPVVSEMQTRMKSRGFGRFRFDYEVRMTMRYEPCPPEDD